MKIHFRLIFTFCQFLLILILISCGKSSEEIRKEKRETLRRKNEQAIIDLSKKHKSILNWDTLDYYTYYYQEMFIEQQKNISFKGALFDITKIDSVYYLHVQYTFLWPPYHHFGRKNHIAKISLDLQNFIEIEEILASENHTDAGCFIFKVLKVNSVFPIIVLESIRDGETAFSYFDYDFDKKLLIFEGELIDFYLYEIDY